MTESEFECQEKIRRLAVKIVKHYRGRGPDNVKVRMENSPVITVEIKGILSNLSEILMKEGAEQLVADYWKILKPHLEKEYMSELKEAIGGAFTYTWRMLNHSPSDRRIVVQLNTSV
ncbi:DUF2294 family protein [Paenibacillus sp. HN-1]|uniref:Na-translocating system protein MpsC family protein n=1 Tax=Paenibacillus TaxID=44249 RepID=UPI001CAA2D76|nr:MULTISPECIES: Na-translocating system protein MpsC family protein [Paenibacillus]MBY9078456.1 DUF2294 family protein [Paenibacillus sp. CGMCC 1.18879]MBY9082749.1 DUF2294 family protein [Paenibacillus sinensis]